MVSNGVFLPGGKTHQNGLFARSRKTKFIIHCRINISLPFFKKQEQSGDIQKYSSKYECREIRR